ncbi:MAG: hypothetical protein WBE52_11445 [Terriglobales bacterium]
MLKQIVVSILFCISLAAQITGPERHVDGNVITSERDPKIRIELPKSVQYVGADRWVLYGIADCELHAFVEANGQKPDGQKNVQRLYWVQFEGYLPTKPDLKHTYDSPRHTQIGGLDFYVDTWVRQNDEKIEPGSDREHIEALLRAKGYKMPAGMMYVRLVHLLDERKRKELMIIYGEDVASTGFTAAELHEGGKAYAQWPAIDKDLIERAEEKITVEKLSKP